jgi:hypothetical protein
MSKKVLTGIKNLHRQRRRGNIDDCAGVSHKVSEVLDRENLFRSLYAGGIFTGNRTPLRKREDYENIKENLSGLFCRAVSRVFLLYGNLIGLVKMMLYWNIRSGDRDSF